MHEEILKRVTPSTGSLHLDASRTVFLQSPLDRRAGTALMARVAALLAEEDQPVTVCIRSRGGHLDAYFEVESFIGSMGNGGQGQVHTVAAFANSAAAYLLVSGHRAFVFPHVTLGFHGAKWTNVPRALRTETALSIAIRLDIANRNVSRRLARRVALRLAARYLSGPQRARTGSFDIGSDIAKQMDERLANEPSRLVLRDALARYRFLRGAIDPQISRAGATPDAASADLLRAVVEAQSAAEPGNIETIDPFYAAEVVMDYILARDLLLGSHSDSDEESVRCCLERALAFPGATPQTPVTPPEQRRHGELGAAQQHALDLWSFAFVLCHRLLSGHNPIVSNDAYWLGLVDEIVENDAEN